MRARRFEARNRRGVLIFSTALILAYSSVDSGGSQRNKIKDLVGWLDPVRIDDACGSTSFRSDKSRTDGSSTLFLREAANTPVSTSTAGSFGGGSNYFQDSLVRKVQIAALLVSFVLYSIFYPRISSSPECRSRF
jgi:hypothetical protein